MQHSGTNSKSVSCKHAQYEIQTQDTLSRAMLIEQDATFLGLCTALTVFFFLFFLNLDWIKLDEYHLIKAVTNTDQDPIIPKEMCHVMAGVSNAFSPKNCSIMRACTGAQERISWHRRRAVQFRLRFSSRWFRLDCSLHCWHWNTEHASMPSYV